MIIKQKTGHRVITKKVRQKNSVTSVVKLPFWVHVSGFFRAAIFRKICRDLHIRNALSRHPVFYPMLLKKRMPSGGKIKESE